MNKIKILVVDDSAVVRQVAKEMLDTGIARTQTYGADRCRILTIDAQQHAET